MPLHKILVSGAQPAQAAGDDGWLNQTTEGQLAVDVYQTDNALVIKSAVAGVAPENLEISIDNDILTIRGARHLDDEVKQEDAFYQECYWGSFSRSIILPMEVQIDKVEAVLKHGLLTITLPKAHKTKSVSIKVQSDDA